VEPRVDQPASIGRIVVYHLPPGEAWPGEAKRAPAIITRVLSPREATRQIVDLTVFPPLRPPFVVATCEQGGPDSPGSWSWPPRV
jgi:hypothetical protein